jgi:hypothetical protein
MNKMLLAYGNGLREEDLPFNMIINQRIAANVFEMKTKMPVIARI